MAWTWAAAAVANATQGINTNQSCMRPLCVCLWHGHRVALDARNCLLSLSLSLSTSPLLLNGSTAQSVPPSACFFFIANTPPPPLLLHYFFSSSALSMWCRRSGERGNEYLLSDSFFYGQTKTRWNYLNECAIKTCCFFRCPLPPLPAATALEIEVVSVQQIILVQCLYYHHRLYIKKRPAIR